jgi:hypothetical protein
MSKIIRLTERDLSRIVRRVINENKRENVFSSEQTSSSNNSTFTFNPVGIAGQYKVNMDMGKLPREFYRYLITLGSDKPDVLNDFDRYTNIEASGEFNRIHFREGIPPKLQGIGLGYIIYQDFIKFLGYASSSDSATDESKRVWSKIVNDPDFYGVVCEDHNVMAISKDWSGDVVSLVKSFISKKGRDKVLYLNNDLLNDYPDLNSYSTN